jgi:predicted SAM-dependent methyltransferase
MRRFLHVGCGPKRKNRTVEAFATPEWDEVTLDIDESVRPDIVDKLPELASVEAESFDAVYSAHNIEHLYPHEVPLALGAMRRVLKPDGFVILTCPDLQSIGERLAAGEIDTPIYPAAWVRSRRWTCCTGSGPPCRPETSTWRTIPASP